MKSFNSSFEKIFKKIILEIKSEDKTLNILNDNYKFNFLKKDLNKFKRYKKIVIIGMGGSILGAEAIYHLFKKKIKKKIYFLNNLDEIKINEVKSSIKINNTLFLIISKSGNTLETITNLFLLKILKKNAKNIILISEKKNNIIFSLSKRLNLFHVEHKQTIGGRYSVLTETGLLPAYLMGLNIKNIRKKIKSHLTGQNKKHLKKNTIYFSKLILEKKYHNLIFLNYLPELEKFLFWCQQLIAESLGKKGKGFLPIISNVPKDHHSLLQIYLDGPKDKFFYIFSSGEKSKSKINSSIFSKKNILHNKKLSLVKNAQKKALIKSFIKNKIPFKEFKIGNLNEEKIGELFSYFILETIIIGKLIRIDPYNQPAVEQVKIYTQKFLK